MISFTNVRFIASKELLEFIRDGNENGNYFDTLLFPC